MSWKRLQDKQLQERLKTRARIVQLIREFFIKEGFLEVETPIVVPSAGQEPYLNPFKIEFWDEQGHRKQGYLITSPEYSHKKLLAAGFEKTFEITRAFRAGEHFGGLHNPEFTMLEWYRANADYYLIMEDVEKMVTYVINALGHKNIEATENQGKMIDLSSPWERLTMQQGWEKYAHISNGSTICDRTYLSRLCGERGYAVKANDTYDDLFFKIFLNEIEPKLGYPKPTILYDYPVSMAALARLKPSPQPSPIKGEGEKQVPLPEGEEGRRTGEGVAERFEVYIAGIELGNAFSELNDAQEQRRRFIEEQKLRKQLGKEPIPLDEDFLDAVGHMPPSSGIAFGVDRLVMLLTNAARIEDVLAFPASEIFKKM